MRCHRAHWWALPPAPLCPIHNPTALPGTPRLILCQRVSKIEGKANSKLFERFHVFQERYFIECMFVPVTGPITVHFQEILKYKCMFFVEGHTTKYCTVSSTPFLLNLKQTFRYFVKLINLFVEVWTLSIILSAINTFTVYCRAYEKKKSILIS